MNKRREFGELELSILELIKTMGEASVHDVLACLKGENRYTTIMTVMNRLVQKGQLSREKISRSYIYTIENQAKSSSLNLLTRLKKRIFGGKSLAMISYLIDSSDDLNIEELEEIINDAKRKKK